MDSGVKAAIAQIHLQKQHDIHSWKVHPDVRKAIVIGSDRKSNIGATIGRHLCDAGFVDIMEPSIDELDVRMLDVVNNYFDCVRADTLILSHGLTHLDWFEDLSAAALCDIIGTNLISSALTAQAFVRTTIDSVDRKTVVFIGSMAYRNVLNGSAIYCASKAGLAMLARCLAWELAPKGYDVYIVHPSNVLGTPMTEGTIQGLMNYQHIEREAAEQYWNTGNPRTTVLTPDEIADVVTFLVMGKAPYLAGGQIDLTGGQR